MKPITFIINGNTPSKKSGQMALVSKKTGVPFILPGQKYRDWHRANTLDGIPCVSMDECPVDVEMFFYRKSKHKFDYVNVGQSVMDLLVDRAIIPDDNSTVARPVFVGYDYDKDNPRCIIKIISRSNDEETI